MSAPTTVYNDNSVGYGSRVEVFSSTGTYVLESIMLTYPTKVTERSNQLGGANGWVAVAGQPTGTAVAQIATYTGTPGQPGQTVIMPKLGETFSDTFSGTNTEKWAVTHIGAPFEMNGYYKVNLNLTQSLFT
jgi:hypothetical protein